ncbi:MAG: phosphatase PAP2 family protein [Myxococcaceae bacterium]|nr:phosphatase PAP2 family protein [Myxococcaceae bacterium]MCA3013564.1 phosphatase PAP2 family protein [Myxococcaceae bacterium]
MTAWRRLLAWDERVLVRVVRWQRPASVRLLRTLTHLGDTPVWLFVGLTLAAAGTAGTKLLALRLGASAGLAALLAQAVKRLSRRRRPNAGIVGFVALVQNPDAFSFPSGHTAAAVAAAIAWAGEGTGLGALAAGFAGLIGCSRVALGAHYPLDVMAGALLGLGCGALARVLVVG